MDVKEEEILGPGVATHWYYVSKGRALRKLLKDTKVDEVLDVGAGSGVFSKQLIDAGLCKRAVCVDPAYPGESREPYGAGEIRFVRSVERVTQRLVLMIDVLEHVDNDLDLLRRYTDTLPVGGLLLVSVPAFQFLWSGHDVFLEHRRRYLRGEVQRLMDAADLRVLNNVYFFGTLFPVVAAMRLADRRRLAAGNIAPKSALTGHSAWVNRSLILIHDLERDLLFPFNRLAGLSVFCLARRDEPTSLPDQAV